MSIRVLVADDDPLMRLGLTTALGTYGDLRVVGEAENGQVAVARCRELSPDIVLMDVRMPVLDGIMATRQIVSSVAACRVIVMTTFDLDEYVYGALRAGASGFLLKNTTPVEMVNGIRAVAAGDAVLAPRITRRLIGTFAERAAHPVDERFQQLTGREREVLVEIAAGLSNAEIAQRLSVADGTVKTHVGRILTKLGLRDRVQIVVYAYRNRLVPPDPSAPKHTT